MAAEAAAAAAAQAAADVLAHSAALARAQEIINAANATAARTIAAAQSYVPAAPVVPAQTTVLIPQATSAPQPIPAPPVAVQPTPAIPSRVTISGNRLHATHLNSVFTITGTAAPLALVTLHFHRAGTAADDYSILRTVTADANGNWHRVVTTSVDYRYFATVANGARATLLPQPEAVTLAGPLVRVVAADQRYTLSGTATPGATVYLHFHKFGMAAGDFGIVRSVIADENGAWARSYEANVDYRVFVSNSSDPADTADRGGATPASSLLHARY